MAQVLKYVPSFIGDCDEDYIPVDVKNFDDVVSIPWISKWAKKGFKHGLWRPGSSYLAGKTFTTPASQHGSLWVVVDFSKTPLLIAFVSDVSLINHLPKYEPNEILVRS